MPLCAERQNVGFYVAFGSNSGGRHLIPPKWKHPNGRPRHSGRFSLPSPSVVSMVELYRPCVCSCCSRLLFFSISQPVNLSMDATKGICQAGGMRGLDDHRSGLVQEIFRVIDECPSVYLVFKLLSAENV